MSHIRSNDCFSLSKLKIPKAHIFEITKPVATSFPKLEDVAAATAIVVTAVATPGNSLDSITFMKTK